MSGKPQGATPRRRVLYVRLNDAEGAAWDRVKASRGENEDGETLRALIGEEDRRVVAREEERG